MKLLYFGGPTTHLEKFASTFAREHDVAAAVFQKSGLPNEILVGGASRATRWTPALAVPKLRRVLERERPDVVHSFYLLPFAFLGARAGVRRHVISAMGSDIYPPGPTRSLRSRLFHLTSIPRDWHRQTASRFDAGVVECEDARARMGALGYDLGRIKVVTWGPDCTVFRPGAGDPALRAELLGGAASLVICTRKHWSVYGVADLLDAFSSAHRDAALALLDSGPRTAALRRRASKLGIADRVRFLGRVAPGEVPRYVASADLLVSPSHSDTISTALLEGMACGLACVSTDVGGTREFVRDGENGLLVPPGRPDLLSGALRRLLDDPKLRSRLGRAARGTVLEKADWSKRWREVEALYEEVARR
jgi:glycosyltransferase involved in cell wall biosynthesis